MYLSRALDELHRAGNAPELWIEPDPFHKDSIAFGGAQQIMTAQNRRLQALRSCMLFAAITVEAFANEFAYHALGAQTAKTIDNLGPAEKIDTALRLAACNEDLLDRGRDPFQTVVTLVKTRNQLVHPKPSNGLAAWTQDLEDSDEDVFGPRAAERAVLAVADLIVLCVPYMPHAIQHGGLAKSVAMNKDLLKAHREAIGNRIRDLPAKDTPATPTLQHQIRGRIKPAPSQG
jgi:hypothetical protein